MQRKVILSITLLAACLVADVPNLAAQQPPPCTTTLECAKVAVQAATEAAAAVSALRGRIDILEKSLNAFDRFTVVQSQFTTQHAEAVCPPNSRIVSAACVGNNGSPQAAVGPQFDFNGSGKAICD